MKTGLVTTALLLVTVVAEAHVTVLPRESQAGRGEKYLVRVPTEGKVSTAEVELEVPPNVTVPAVGAPAGWTYELKRQGDRIVTIIWKMEIKPAEFAEFPFMARNPKQGTEIVWKVRQRYADGTSVDWVGPAGDRRPASVTKLVAAEAAPASRQTGGDAAAIAAWLKGYDEALVAKDLEKLATFYHPDVTIYEGGGINRGWADYRDHHLGPELKAFENLQFGHSNVIVQMLGRDAAYVTADYAIKAQMKERAIDAGGLATMIVIRDGGGWKIRHSHTSSRRRPAQAQP